MYCWAIKEVSSVSPNTCTGQHCVRSSVQGTHLKNLPLTRTKHSNQSGSSWYSLWIQALVLASSMSSRSRTSLDPCPSNWIWCKMDSVRLYRFLSHPVVKGSQQPSSSRKVAVKPQQCLDVTAIKCSILPSSKLTSCIYAKVEVEGKIPT